MSDSSNDQNREEDNELLRKHEDYLKRIYVSGIPAWVADLYKDTRSILSSGNSKSKQDESIPKTPKSDGQESDPHLFI